MGWSGPMTHKQYLAWQSWLNLDLNKPGKTEAYIMGLRCDIQRAWSRNPANIHYKDQQIKFEFKVDRDTEIIDPDDEDLKGKTADEIADILEQRKIEEVSAAARSAWLGRLKVQAPDQKPVLKGPDGSRS